MSEELHRTVIALDADITRMERNLRKANRLVDGKLDKIDSRVKKSDQRFSKWGKNVARSIQVGVVAAVAFAGKQALATADKIDVLQDRIKDATRESGGFQEIWDGITKTAIQTGGAIENNVSLVQRLAIAAKDLGGTNDQFIQLNDTIQKLGVIGGATSAGMAAGTLQLAQGLGEGVFRAQEFNSLLENIPSVAEMIAKKLGKSTSELRKMVLAGELASKDVFNALLDSSDEVEARYAEVPPRMERAWGGFLNALSLKMDDLNEKFAATGSIASLLVNLTKSLDVEKLSTENIFEQAHVELQVLLGLMSDEELAARQLLQQADEKATKEKELNDLIKERLRLLQDISMVKGDEDGLALLNGRLAKIESKITAARDANIDERNVDAHPSTPPIFGYMANSKDKPSDSPIRAGIRDATTELQGLIAASERQEELVGKTAAQQARITAEYEIQDSFAKQGLDIDVKKYAKLQEILTEYENQVEATEELTESFEKLEQAADQFAEDFGQIFINSVANGEDALTALGKSFKNTLIKMAADALIINPLKQLFSPDGGNLIGGFFKALGLAPRAAGGDVQGSSPYMVGENGPELFIPKSAGNIRPNRENGTGGRNIVVNQTITLSPDVSPTIAAQIMQAAPMIADEARRRVAEDLAGRIVT